jgi:membrane protease YdiL (CAAX protease family)
VSQTAGPEPATPAPDAGVAAPDAATPRLGILPTFGWSLLIFAIGQAAGTAVVAAWNLANGMPALMVTGYDGMLVALLTLVTNPLQVALFAGVARWRTGIDPRDYLALTRFSARDFWVGFGAIVALAAAVNVFSRLAGFDTVSTFETDIFTSSRTEGWLAALLLAIVVVGPIGEEVMFRGFLFRGWVTAGWRGALAIVVITVLWSAMHIQYDWFGISQVFLTGLVLGWIRWRSGSCLLTIVLHMLVNFESTIETTIRVSGT